MEPRQPKKRLLGVRTGYWWLLAGLLWAAAGFISNPAINFPIALMNIILGLVFLRREQPGQEDQ